MTTRPGDGEAHPDARNTRLNVGERPGIADVDVRVGADLRVRVRIDMRSAAEGGAPNRVRHWAQAQAVSGGADCAGAPSRSGSDLLIWGRRRWVSEMERSVGSAAVRPSAQLHTTHVPERPASRMTSDVIKRRRHGKISLRWLPSRIGRADLCLCLRRRLRRGQSPRHSRCGSVRPPRRE